MSAETTGEDRKQSAHDENGAFDPQETFARTIARPYFQGDLACRGELSFTPRDLQLTLVAVAEHDDKPIGVAQVKVVDDEEICLSCSSNPARFAAASVR
jgi:hypothetical protein